MDAITHGNQILSISSKCAGNHVLYLMVREVQKLYIWSGGEKNKGKHIGSTDCCLLHMKVIKNAIRSSRNVVARKPFIFKSSFYLNNQVQEKCVVKKNKIVLYYDVEPLCLHVSGCSHLSVLHHYCHDWASYHVLHCFNCFSNLFHILCIQYIENPISK